MNEPPPPSERRTLQEYIDSVVRTGEGAPAAGARPPRAAETPCERYGHAYEVVRPVDGVHLLVCARCLDRQIV